MQTGIVQTLPLPFAQTFRATASNSSAPKQFQKIVL